MKLITTAVAAAGALAAAGAVSLATAGADAGDVAATTQPIGTQGTVENGGVIQGWTVSDLRPSTDAIPYQPRGTLWEATATDVAIQGNVTPVIANLGARSPSGQTYPALFGVATPQGVNPSNLAQGEKTSGKVYFDVTGDAPNSAVYQFAGKDQLVWTPAAPPAPSGGGSSTPAAGSQPNAGAASQKPAQSGTQTTPAPADNQTTGSSSTPGATGSQGTPLASGSQGTPLPAEADGTPAGANGTEGTPAAASGSEAPTSAGTPEASAPANSGGTDSTPAAAGSSGTPLPAETPGATTGGSEGTAPANPQGTEGGNSTVPAGNQGTQAPSGAGGASNATG